MIATGITVRNALSVWKPRPAQLALNTSASAGLRLPASGASVGANIASCTASPVTAAQGSSTCANTSTGASE